MRTIVKSILLTFSVAAPGCIDADPSQFARDAAADVVVVRPDVMIDDDSGDVMDPNAACKACLEAPEDPGPGCKSAVDACKADETCSKIYDCGFANGCWGLPIVPQIQLCGYTNCIAPAGTPLDSPSVALATAIVICDDQKCNPIPCGPTP